MTDYLVKVVPDKPDWHYQPGERVRFDVQVLADQMPLNGVSVTYTIGWERSPVRIHTAVVPPTGRLILESTPIDHPGFLRCQVWYECAGKKYRGLVTVGFAPESIRPIQRNPPDFDDFWKRNLMELARLPLDPYLTSIPDQNTEKVEVFQVDLQNVGITQECEPSRLYGVLCVPRVAGPLPAIMTPPGAGVQRIHADIAWAERGFLTFRIDIHGIPQNLPDERYVTLGAKLGRYERIGLESRDRHYFRRVCLGCVRANDFLVSHVRWDGRNLVVMGGCQGGYLAMATAALDSRVTACRISFPDFCDVTRHPGHQNVNFGKIARSTAYYDGVNFARRIKAPGHYAWGYNDERCSPSAMFAAFNVITAPKTIAVFKEMRHLRVPQLTIAESEWLMRQVEGRKIRN